MENINEVTTQAEETTAIEEVTEAPEATVEVEATAEPAVAEPALEGNIFKRCRNSVKGVYNKCVDWFKKKTKNVKWKVVWDKFTTGLLIFLMCSPLIILGYIFLWFILK